MREMISIALARACLPHGGLHPHRVVDARCLVMFEGPTEHELGILVAAAAVDGGLSDKQRSAVRTYARAVAHAYGGYHSDSIHVTVRSLFEAVGAGDMPIQHSNSNRRGPSGTVRPYPQETPQEYTRRVDELRLMGSIEIEPPTDIGAMSDRPLMMAQYLLDAWVVRDEWGKVTWTNHMSECTTEIMAMCDRLAARISWEMDALEMVRPPVFYVGAKWTQNRDTLIVYFFVSADPIRHPLQFESPSSTGQVTR